MKNKICPYCHNNKSWHSTDCPKSYVKDRGNKNRNRFRSERSSKQEDYFSFFRER